MPGLTRSPLIDLASRLNLVLVVRGRSRASPTPPDMGFGSAGQAFFSEDDVVN
jgi:hypothetical protein